MIFHFLHAHRDVLKWIIIACGAVVAAGLIWRFALRPWLRNIRYSRRSAAHARPAPLADPVWGDTGQHDRVWDREVAEPGYFPETGSLLEPLPPAPHARAWEQDRPVRTVSLPPWVADDVREALASVHRGETVEREDYTAYAEEPDDRCVSCRAEVDHYLGCPDDPDPDYEAEAEYLREQEAWSQMPGAEPGTCGRCGTVHIPDAAPYGCARELPLGATIRDGMSGDREIDPPGGRPQPSESGSLSPRTPGETPASVTAGRAPRAWSGVLGAPDPQNLLVPDPTVSPAPAPTAGLPVRDEQPDLSGPAETAQGTRTPLGFPGCRVGEPGLAGQDGTGVLTGEIHPGPLPEPEDDEPPTVTITVISAADTGPWQDDGWRPALPEYITEHLPDGCQSTSDYLDAMFDGITGTAQLALTGATP